MRVLLYKVVNTKEQVKSKVFSDYKKAEDEMKNLKNTNPNGDYKIAHKWHSI